VSTETGLIVQTSRELLPSQSDFDVMCRMADMIAKSGSLKGITTGFQALAIMQRGRELGIPPMQALSSIYIVQNRTSISAELVRALILRDHGDDALIIDEMSNERSVIRYKRASWKEYKTGVYTKEDAEKAKLWDSGDTWKKFPDIMLLSRNSTKIGRATFPDTLGGMFTTEEAADMEAAEREETAPPRNITHEATPSAAPTPSPSKPKPSPNDPAPESWLAELRKLAADLREATGDVHDIPADLTRANARAMKEMLVTALAESLFPPVDPTPVAGDVAELALAEGAGG
jgi:hypothetical protein